jgi:hypothetical protein
MSVRGTDDFIYDWWRRRDATDHARTTRVVPETPRSARGGVNPLPLSGPHAPHFAARSKRAHCAGPTPLPTNHKEPVHSLGGTASQGNMTFCWTDPFMAFCWTDPFMADPFIVAGRAAVPVGQRVRSRTLTAFQYSEFPARRAATKECWGPRTCSKNGMCCFRISAGRLE